MKSMLLFDSKNQRFINPAIPLSNQGITSDFVILTARFHYTITIVYDGTSNEVEYITGMRFIQFLTTIIYVRDGGLHLI